MEKKTTFARLRYWYESFCKLSLVYRIGVFFIFITFLFLNIFRFVGLEKSPPGFYLDEMAGASHVVCLVQGGTDVWGTRYPLFTSMYGVGGYSTPVYLYSEFLWVQLFGTSVESFRALIAFFSVLGIFGLIYLGYLLGGVSTGVLAGMIASTSPWVWQVSRVAWDPPLMSVCIIYAFIFLVRALMRTDRYASFCIAGVLFSLSAYTYLPARFSVPILSSFFVYYGIKKKLYKQTLVFLSALCGTSIPLLLFLIQSPGSTQRVHNLFIANMYFQGQDFFEKWTNTFGLFLKQMLMYIDPRYLFIEGDKNLRHGVGFSGIFGGLEIYIVCLVFLYLFLCICFRHISFVREYLQDFSVHKLQKYIVLRFKILTILLSLVILFIIPAALTGEQQPHALRSIGAYPFLVLLLAFSGSIVFSIIKSEIVRKVVFTIGVAVMTVYSVWFIHEYFTQYPIYAKKWFSVNVIDYAQSDEVVFKGKSISEKYSGVGIGSVYLDYQYRKINSCRH
jgi:4-amino-4-deoxy-L-arabinose transferase-like glycosyltransferase